MTPTPLLTRPPLQRLARVPFAASQPALPVAPPPRLDDEASRDEEAARVAAAFCRVVAETVTGRRPYTQLLPALGPRPATVVADLLRGPRLEVLRATRVRHQVPRGGVIEASARLCSPRASCALALRLERFEVGWVAVALEAALIGDTRPRR